MGRPKEFSREHVLEKAIPVFFKRGFADTSVQDLEKATGVNKSGLYSEFKGKDDLYLESLRFYLSKGGAIGILERKPQGLANIVASLKHNNPCMNDRGCLLANSVREVSVLPPQSRQILTEHFDVVKKLMIQNLKAAKIKGDPSTVAEMLLTFQAGLALEQNLGMTQAAFERKVDDFVAVIAQA